MVVLLSIKVLKIGVTVLYISRAYGTLFCELAFFPWLESQGYKMKRA